MCVCACVYVGVVCGPGQSTFTVNATEFVSVKLMLDKWVEAYSVAALIGLIAGMCVHVCCHLCACHGCAGVHAMYVCSCARLFTLVQGCVRVCVYAYWHAMYA